MAEIREECRYTKTHEWARLEEDIAVCGIDDYAQSQTGELVFVELPEVGDEVKAGDDVCVIESVKSASDVYTPVSGTIVEVNDALIDTPNLVNESCYDDGWLFKVQMDDVSEFDDLLAADEYAKEVDEA
ncbi:glycine cleavage system protein GcvH [Facilibium subflavum]|uniref:glycine cleavage system protein GcvH n=1 Tax=Facilibium subflavum TaxID=2219058 RepID=UPI000E6470FF|nr:glycine cleavage system protein GcvH [Facilibium subflavum]